jgi:Chromo (CHRromatin Organisation MOdifier) domain
MPYKETDTHGANFPQPAPDLVEGQEEWEVEKVLDSRRKGRRKDLQYLLKWRGYADADNMWEDADQVFAKDLISQFHKENPKAIKVIRFKEGDKMAGNASSETSGPSPSHPSIASVLTSIDFSSPTFQTYRVPRMSGASLPNVQDDTFLSVPPTSPPPLRVPLCQPSDGSSSRGARDDLSKGLPGTAESIPEEEEEESHHVSLEESIPEVSELHYPSDVGSEQVRATTSRVEEGMPEVEIMVTREETRAELPVHSIHNMDTDSESTAEAIRREFGDDFPGLPWTPNTGFSNISVRQRNGTFADTKYVQFAIEGEEPYIYSCNGIGAPEYWQKLYTSTCYNQFPHNPEETIDTFLDESFFQCASLRRAELLGDMGILAEIYCHRHTRTDGLASIGPW